jgi:hypothetical protein
MAEEIEFKAKIDTSDSVAKLKQLTKELRSVEVGTERFKELQRQIDDTKESIEASRASAGNFFDILGKLPGPIGLIGGALSGTVAAIKQFTLIKFSAISESLVELGKDFVDIGKNILNTTGITKLYAASNEFLAKSFVKVGISEEAAAVGARAFSAALIATGIGAIIVAVGLLAANWDKVTDALTGATEETKTYDEAQKEVNKQVADFQTKLYGVQDAFAQAKAGTISKQEALKKYNDTLGATVGFAGSLEQAEALMTANTQTVIESIKLRTQAQVFYGKAAEASARIVSGEGLEPGFWEALGEGILNFGNVTEGATKRVIQFVDKNTKASKSLEAEGKRLSEAAIENDKKLKKGLAAPPDFKGQENAFNEAKKQIEAYIALGKKSVAETKFNQDSLIAGRQKELATLKTDYDKNIELAKQFGMSQSAITLSYEQQRLGINKKYNDAVNKSIQDFISKSQELRKTDRQKELDNAKETYDKLIIQAKETGQDTLELTEAYNQQKLSINKKYDEEDLQAKNDFNAKVQEILTASITNDVEREKKARQDKLAKDLADLEKDKEFIKLSEEEKNTVRLALKQTAENDITNIETNAEIGRLDKKLRLLELNGQALLRGTKSYYDNRRNIINELESKELLQLQSEYDKKLLSTEEFEKAQADIKKKYAQQRKDVSTLELNDYLQYATQILGAINGVFSQASNVQKMQQEQDIKDAEGNTEKIEKIKRKGFEDNKKIQIAQAIIGTLQSAVQAYQSLAVIPIVGPALGAAAAAASLIFGYKQVALIKAQKYESSSGSGQSASAGSGISIPTTPQIQQTAAPQITTGVAQNPQNQIAQTLAQTTQKPVEAFVVSTSVSSQQQLDRRTNRAATL